MRLLDWSANVKYCDFYSDFKIGDWDKKVKISVATAAHVLLLVSTTGQPHANMLC